MSQPDYRAGYLRIPLGVWVTIFCRPLLTRRQFQLVAVVVRESWGWQTPSGQVHSWTRALSSRFFADATGLSTDRIARDLLALVEREVLREEEGRYQFVADPRLWKTLLPSPPKARSAPPKPPLSTAASALRTGSLKIGKIRKDNGPLPPVGRFPQVVEKSSSSRVVPAPEARLADIVAAFVGSLSGQQADALRRWICEDGVAAVWTALEPAFRQGPLVARQALEALLLEWRERESGTFSSRKEADA